VPFIGDDKGRKKIVEINSSDQTVEKSNVMGWFAKTSIVVKSIKDVTDAIIEGSIRLPLYQRDSVWEEARVCALWDSILRKFPLPSFFLAEGVGDSRRISCDVGRDATSFSGTYFDLLDGQQRLTSIIKGLTKNSSLRLWIDLAPSVQLKAEVHPFQFDYWIHPCTSTFPFGFKMKVAGEHRFENLSDADIREIWTKLQCTEHKDKEFFEIPLSDSFPWMAACPIPFDELLSFSFENESEEWINNKIMELAEQQKVNISKKRESYADPDIDTVRKLARALFDLSDYSIALQKTSVGADNFTLFERIGRGGMPISQRQLTVSRLILEMGRQANDAVAEFQKGKWKDILDTEEIIHALARISYSGMQAPLDGASDDQSWKSIYEFDMYELDLQRIKILKQNPEKWTRFLSEMKRNCQRLELSFDTVLSNILVRRQDAGTPEYGLSLVQIAQAKKDGGIEPISLHPLLYWAFYIYKDGVIVDKDLRKNMLQWILFSNGIVTNPAHKKLNQLAFYRVVKYKSIDFLSTKQDVFFSFSEKELEEVGLLWNKPIFSINKVVDIPVKNVDIPAPEIVVERTFRRLLFRNWADKSGVNDFMLMWNQREMLDKIYGDIEPKYIHALYGKGRPIDADHILARNLLSGHVVSVSKENVELAMQRFLPESYQGIVIALTENTFRLYLPNLNGNFRFWPKFLNRADKDGGVNEKLPRSKLIQRLGNHPMAKKFSNVNDEEIGWNWSAIEHKSSWEDLPPADKKWSPTVIGRFVSAVMEREYHLYANGYEFLMSTSDRKFSLPKFDVENLILD
jgi:hypothetical protein